jgi:Rab-GTPase-TBC domain
MRKDCSVLETALQLTFFPLLKAVDSELFNFIFTQSHVVMPSFAVPWVSNWFASEIADIGAASRLVDFLIVSHAAAPVYCVVALVTLCRQHILRFEPELSNLYAVLRSLPQWISPENNDDPAFSVVADTSLYAAPSTMLAVEHIIATALEYMYVAAFLWCPDTSFVVFTHALFRSL